MYAIRSYYGARIGLRRPARGRAATTGLCLPAAVFAKGGSALDLEQHRAVFDLDGEGLGAADVWGHGFTVLHLDLPVVKRADDGASGDDALGQGPALVWALVMHGEDLVLAVAEDGDVAMGGGFHHPRAEDGNVLQRSYNFV